MPINGFFGNPIQVNVPYLDLSNNLRVKYGRNPKSIRNRLNRWTKQSVVPAMFGNYLYFDPAYIGRLGADATWAYNSNRPEQLNDGETFTTKRFECVRYQFEDSLDLTVEQAANFPVQKIVTEAIAMRAMLNRTKKMVDVATTSGNYASANVVTANTAAGGFLDTGTTANPVILNAFNYARNLIQLGTASSFEGGEFGVLMNPVTARKLMATRELREYLMQMGNSINMIAGNKDDVYWAGEGLPSFLYNAAVIVENATYNTNNIGAASDVQSYIFPDNTLVFFVREGDLDLEDGSMFSTFTQFVHEDMTVEAITDQWNRRIKFAVTDNFVGKMTAQPSGVLMTNIFS